MTAHDESAGVESAGEHLLAAVPLTAAGIAFGRDKVVATDTALDVTSRAARSACTT